MSLPLFPQNVSPVEQANALPSRNVSIQFYDFFHYPYSLQQKMDIWTARGAVAPIGTYRVVNYGEGTSIFVVIWEEGGAGTGKIYYYAPMRVKVNGTGLSEINIDTVKSPSHRAFIPNNLMGSTPPLLSGGYANLNWYLEHVNKTRAAQLGLTTAYDGYATELRGTVTMDVTGAEKVLGTSSATPGTVLTWFTLNQGNVENQWITWLNYEANIRDDIYNFYGGPFTGAGNYPNRKPLSLSMTTGPGSNEVTLQINAFYDGTETLLARWFKETFLHNYEYYYTDIKFSFQMGPTTSAVQLDTAIELGLYMWSRYDTGYAPSVWSFENVYGDYLPSGRYNSAYHYAPDYDNYYTYNFLANPTQVVDPGNGIAKKYFWVGPGQGSTIYNSYNPYDYTPSAFNLTSGETLRLNYTTNRKVWVLDQTPTGLYNRTGLLAVGRFEPFLADIPSGQAIIDVTGKMVTFTGPLDMGAISYRERLGTWLALADNYRLSGVLPWGAPYIEFNLIPHSGVPGDVNGDGKVDILDQIIVGVNYGTRVGGERFEPMADIWTDGIVDNYDLLRVGVNIPRS